jgi:3-methyladenine DNA glycosylase AlkD
MATKPIKRTRTSAAKSAVVGAAKPRAKPRRLASQPVERSGRSASEIAGQLFAMGSKQGAALAGRFFKTEEGGYAAGDKFLGIKMPTLRAYARDLGEVGLDVALPLLKSSWHEARSLALIVLVKMFERGPPALQAQLYKLYLDHLSFINNWDLVDMSAPQIIGAWLSDKPGERRKVLTRLAKSPSIWERRIAILATYYLIRQGDAGETFRIAKLLLRDDEDLIHKAVGWMLREVGQRVGEETEETFLKQFYKSMPRTMLRYAIERFSPEKRKQYLLGLV